MNITFKRTLCAVTLSLYTINASAMLSRLRPLASVVKQSSRALAPRVSVKLKSAGLKKGMLYSAGLTLASGSAGLALNKAQEDQSQKAELNLELISSC